MDPNTMYAGLGAVAVAAGVAYMCFGGSASKKGFKQYAIAEAKALENGKMQEVTLEVDGKKKQILIIKTSKGKYRATGAKCTHYGAQMSKGVLAGDRLTCPWHAACFNVNTGDIEDGPVFDKLPVYETVVDSAGNVSVLLPNAAAMVSKVEPHMCPASASNQKHFVIIGGGPCGLAAAETLRQNGFDGKLTMLSKEAGLPYDKTKLSKNMAAEMEGLVLRKQEWFTEHGINVRSGEGAIVRSVRTSPKEVVLASGEIVAYDKLLCASGGPARTFRPGEMFVTPGAALGSIFPLRDTSHSSGIESAVEEFGADKVRVVIVGSSFIGMEAAAYLISQKKVKDVTVLGMESVPFERVLGPAMGKFMQTVHEAKGVKFIMNCTVTEYMAAGKGKVVNKLKATQKPDGKVITLDADVVILGAGIIPAVEYLKETPGVTLLAGAPGGVEVTAGMGMAGASGSPDVFAAGDIAYFPYCPPGAHKAHGTRIEHWDVAIDQGRVAALNMLGKEAKYSSIPFFWTSQYGKNLRYAGHSLKTDDIIVHGEMQDEKSEFTAFFVADGRVAAVATWNRDPQGVAALELMRLAEVPAPDQLRKITKIDLVEYLRTVSNKRA